MPAAGSANRIIGLILTAGMHPGDTAGSSETIEESLT